MIDDLKIYIENEINSINKLDFEIIHSEENNLLKKYKNDDKLINIYDFTCILEKEPSFYKDFFWDIDRMKDLNKNIIKNIEIIYKDDNKMCINTLFSFITKNISLKEISRKEELFLIKKSENQYIIYGNLLKNQNKDKTHKIEEGFSYLSIGKYGSKTIIKVITKYKLKLPSIFKSIQHHLFLRTLIKIKNL